MAYSIYDAFLADIVYKVDKKDADSGGTILRHPDGTTFRVILATDQNASPTGYQGALFKNEKTGDCTFASRGTEPKREFLNDVVIADLGMAIGMIPAQAQDYIGN